MEVARLVELLGNKKAVAEALGLAYQTVYGWGKDVPPKQLPAVLIALETKSIEAAERSKLLAREAKELRTRLTTE
ncbi:Cro/CI family transcriptional regulator [Pseudomonas sp. UMAB-40]|uniref:Cro/CI family transcriptional regulator n=1 Tax=Pseudomonas sp. UMAB-40 TaxID=1365407 RepID=UPI001C5683C4|nr:Cro/CI family transcriptional regulator [Pseudomonas sp. UMAB-40]